MTLLRMLCFLKVVDDWILNHGHKKVHNNIHLEQIENDNENLKSKVIN
jgi:hypothetical protein